MKMKKYISVVIVLLICACGFASCTSIDHQLGKFISTAAIDHLENELSADLDTSYETLERLSDGEIAELTATFTQADVELEGEITCAILLSVKNDETGYWAEQLSIGLCDQQDTGALMRYYQKQLKDELDEGTALLIDGGWFISVTRSSEYIPQD